MACVRCDRALHRDGHMYQVADMAAEKTATEEAKPKAEEASTDAAMKHQRGRDNGGQAEHVDAQQASSPLRGRLVLAEQQARAADASLLLRRIFDCMDVQREGKKKRIARGRATRSFIRPRT